jgi:hypothetical protein
MDMTMLVYEKLGEFIEKLETLDKETTMYMTVVHAKQNETLVATIRMQFAIGESSVFHTFNYSEGMGTVNLIPVEAFDLLPDDAQRNMAKKRYEAELDVFNKSVTDEYEKAKQLLVQLGFTKIVSTYSV